jgi:hypothetical protein
MRTLLVGALAATLIGCSCMVPPQASMEECSFSKGFDCFERTAASQPVEPRPTSLKTGSSTAKIKSAAAVKKEKPSSAHARGKADLVMTTAKSPAAAVKVEPPATGQPAETPDPVVTQAKIRVAAKMEDPASAEFGEMKRAIRKNMLGQSIDTICGRVKGRKVSGEDTGDRPFLYLVKDDDAYVVDGSAGSAAAIAYRNICN